MRFGGLHILVIGFQVLIWVLNTLGFYTAHHRQETVGVKLHHDGDANGRL